jgi:hypothetical protein
MSIISNKFELGELVNGGGRIWSMMSGLDYIEGAAAKTGKLTNYTGWDSKYPNWKNEPVYYIQFSSKIPCLSFEEFLELVVKLPEEHKDKSFLFETLYKVYCETNSHDNLCLPEQAVTPDDECPF